MIVFPQYFTSKSIAYLQIVIYLELNNVIKLEMTQKE